MVHRIYKLTRAMMLDYLGQLNHDTDPQKGWRTGRELAVHFGVTSDATLGHLRKLLADGLVEREERPGRGFNAPFVFFRLKHQLDRQVTSYRDMEPVDDYKLVEVVVMPTRKNHALWSQYAKKKGWPLRIFIDWAVNKALDVIDAEELQRASRT